MGHGPLLGLCLFKSNLRAMADLVFVYKLVSSWKNLGFGALIVARTAVMLDLLRVESSSNIKWTANARPEDALAPNFLLGINLHF